MDSATSCPHTTADGAMAGLPGQVDTLGFPPDQMRALGYRMVDLVVDRILRRATEPAIKTGTPEDLERLLGGALPVAGMDATQALELLASSALQFQQHGDHPRYFARVPGPAAYAAILGEWLSTGFNAIATSWEGGSGPAALELTVVRWLQEFLGLPAPTEGVLVSGGSLANLTALSVARVEVGQGVAYLSDQTHACVARGLRVMGLAEGDIRVLETDNTFRMSPARLAEAVREDRAAGRKPWLAVASAGSVNTGAWDPLGELSRICKDHGMWLHVDGAYGGVAAAAGVGPKDLAAADSVVIDPHKWLFQPYDVGACFVQRQGALERCFAMTPEYLKDVAARDGRINFGNRSLELTRRSRAAKLWMSFRTHGSEAFQRAIFSGIQLAEAAERHLREQAAKWEVVSPAQFGIVCFALRDERGVTHAARAKRLADSGYACVTSSQLKGRSMLRLCTINPLTTITDITQTIEHLGKD